MSKNFIDNWKRRENFGRYIVQAIILCGFISASVYFLFLPNMKNHDSGFVSSELTIEKNVKANIVQSSFVDANGKITLAIDKHYATIVQCLDDNGRIVEEYYLDQNGKQVGYFGYYRVSCDYRENTKRITYFDKKGRPMEISAGYSIIICTLNEEGQEIDNMYYNANLLPVKSVNGYYGIHHVYNEQEHDIIYLGLDGLPANNIFGYAMEKCLVDTKNRIIVKMFADKEGKQAQGELGQFGECYSYDEDNRIKEITYLDVNGNPKAISAGYTSLKLKYYRDGTRKSIMYFDSLGNPYALSKGQYGIKYTDEISLYLDKYGRKLVCVDNLLSEYPFLVVIMGCIVCILFCCLPRKLQASLMVFYVIFIFYETLMFREISNMRINLKLFSYGKDFFSSFSVRKGVINNIWLFIPFGTGLYVIFTHKKVWIVAFFFSIIIELIQYLTGLGIVELDDIFGNTLGGVLGVMLGSILMKTKV